MAEGKVLPPAGVGRVGRQVGPWKKLNNLSAGRRIYIT